MGVTLYSPFMKLYLKILLLACLLYPMITATAQKKIIEKLASNKPDTTRSSSFLPLPAIGYSQETGLEFGVVALYSFYSSKKDISTRNSSISSVVSFTTKKQSNLKLQADIWAPQNRYHYLSEIRYKNFPFNFYGIGDQTNEANKDVVVQKLFRLSGEIEKSIRKGYYGGINSGFENYRFSDKEPGGIYGGTPFTGKPGGKVLFVGVSQVLDTRNTNTYTGKGAYLKLNYSYAPDLFGGDNYTGGLLKADFRAFKSLDKKIIMGLNVMHQALLGKNAPFYLLPQLGNDQMMRGYYSGRYRDEKLLAAQMELRYRLIPRLGFVAFAGAGSVYGIHDFRLAQLKPSFGGGMRYFFDVERGLSIRLDYGIGEKRVNEERQKGFYISLGEAF